MQTERASQKQTSFCPARILWPTVPGRQYLHHSADTQAQLQALARYIEKLQHLPWHYHEVLWAWGKLLEDVQ